MQAFLLATQLLTRLPVKLDESAYADQQLAGRSVLYYPLVGIIIGFILVITNYLLTTTGLQQGSLLLAGLILTVWVLITGALHLDGLGDSADAWLGGYGDLQRTLEIMKDPYSGPAAVVSIGLVLIIKFSTLVELDSSQWILLIITPMLARAAIIVLFLTTPYVRKNGMGETAALHIPEYQSKIVLFILSLIIVLALGYKAIFVLISVAIIFYFLRHLMIKRIEGTTGDTAGAMIEVIECGLLVICVI